MTQEEQSNFDKPKKSLKEKQKSRFRKLSIGKGRLSSSKEKHTNEEAEGLLQGDQEENHMEEEQVTTKRRSGAPTVHEIEFKDVPVYIICPNCEDKVISKISTKRAKEAICASTVLCLLQCYCCFWIPLTMDGFKNVIHTCPRCKEQIGIYKRVNLL